MRDRVPLSRVLLNRVLWLPVLIYAGMPTDGFVAAEPITSKPFRVIASPEGYLLTEGDDKILFYQRAPKSWQNRFTRAHYVHPLYDLEGNILTEDFPEDHRHHRGVFWAWHQVWVGDKRIGDPWVLNDFSWDVRRVDVVENGQQSVTLRTCVHWKSPQWVDAAGQRKPLVCEMTCIRAHRADADSRIIDFEIRLCALEDQLQIGGSDDEKGYGGFSLRLRQPPDFRFRGPEGAVRPQELSIAEQSWMDFSGDLGGEEDGRPFGVAVLCHPSLVGYPQRWILRSASSMQNPVYPGRHPVRLKQQEPLTLRYRIVVHRGHTDLETIHQWQSAFATLP